LIHTHYQGIILVRFYTFAIALQRHANISGLLEAKPDKKKEMDDENLTVHAGASNQS